MIKENSKYIFIILFIIIFNIFPVKAAVLEKISSPDQMKYYQKIEKKGKDLYGIKIEQKKVFKNTNNSTSLKLEKNNSLIKSKTISSDIISAKNTISQQGAKCDYATKNFSMAFVLVANTSAELTATRISKLNVIKDKFSQEFYSATDNLAHMNTDYPVFAVSRENLNNYSLGEISKKFYETYSDDFDFISIYAVNGASSSIQTSHESVQNKIKGIGMGLFNNSVDFGSKGRLLGVNYIKDIDILPLTGLGLDGGLLHETGHQYCCFVGKNFDPESKSLALGIIQESMHFFSGLESPYRCGTPMNSNYWLYNGDGTYKQSKECIGSIKYHPFQLYFMGLYDKNNFDYNKKFNIYYSKLDMNAKAKIYKQVSINDIIKSEGQRTCSLINSAPIPPTLKY